MWWLKILNWIGEQSINWFVNGQIQVNYTWWF